MYASTSPGNRAARPARTDPEGHPEPPHGDLLAIFSDGVTEAENAAGEQFEATRLSELLIQHACLPLDELLKVVTEHLTRWIHDPETRDDITLVLARQRPAAAALNS
jgi:serine phosphatase RsbU (regulator of sigma subunit)